MSVYIDVPFSNLPEDNRSTKISLLNQAGITQASFEISVDQTSFPLQLLGACRIYHLDETELYFIQKHDLESICNLNFEISPQNELRTIIFLTRSFQLLQDHPELLDQYKKNLSSITILFQSKIPVSPCKVKLDDAQSAALKQWATSNSVIHHVDLADFEDTGRGMVLSNKVKANDPIIQCDARLFMSYFSAIESPDIGQIFRLIDLDEDSTLILFLIFEKFANPNSFWKPYLELLPSEIDSALFFEEADLQYLAGTYLDYEITMTTEHLLESYNELFPRLTEQYPDVFKADIFSWENFKWARAMFDSRGFNLMLKGNARNCLLPFIDSINTYHYTHVQSRGHISNPPDDDATGTLGQFILPALVDCEDVGNQLFLNYGGFSSRELLLFYGFLYEEANPYDLYNLTLDLPEDEDAEERIALVAKLGLTTEHYLRASSLSPKLLQYLAIVLLPRDKLTIATKMDEQQLIQMLSLPQHMRGAHDVLASTIEALRNNLVESNPFIQLNNNEVTFPSSRAKLALQYARSQLHILDQSMQLCQINKQRL